MKPIFFLLSLCIIFQNLAAQSTILSNPSDCALDLEITDNQCPDGSTFFNPNQFGIEVTNAPGTQLGIDVYLQEVRLIIKHDWAGDIEARLISPSGTEILLTNDVGGSNNNYGNPNPFNCSEYLSLSADACVSIADLEQANPPFIDQAYRPMESLLGFDDASNPNGIWTLSICDDVEEDVGTLEFVELVFAPLVCLPISDVFIENQDSTSVLLNWVPNGDCGSVTTLIEYGPPGFTPGTDDNPGTNGTLVTASCPPFLLTGLPAESSIDLYIRKQCGPTTFSNNTCGTSLETGCVPPGPTTTENFDDETICSSRCERSCEIEGSWYNDLRDDIDWIVFQGSTPTQGTGPLADVSTSGKYVYLESSGSACPEGSEAILLSECFELQKRGADTCHFSFHYFMNGFNVGSLKVEVTDDGGLTWSPIWERSGPQADQWIKTYLSLNQFADGTLLQLRFVGTKGNGPQGDIALDDISYHGSIPIGRPSNFFYVDADGDGFGDPAFFVASCLSNPPTGFVNIAGDCDDTKVEINPNAVEIPCDGIDNNCNGLMDDGELPIPRVINDTICSGETPFLQASAFVNGLLFWYDSPDSDFFLGFGEVFSPTLPPNNTPQPVLHTFYVEETDLLNCKSIERAAVSVLVLPRPDAVLQEQISICPGDSLDLNSINIIDNNLTGASIEFYTQFPLTEDNLISNTVVSPTTPTTYLYRLTTPSGCTFDGSIPVSILSKPVLSFAPAPTFSLCFESSQEISVSALQTLPPATFRWNTGEESQSITALAGTIEGVNQSYVVTVTSGNGCSSIDSVVVLTTASIDSVNRIIQDVSSCEGNNGSISIEPLGGVAPYTYTWASTNGTSGDTLVNGTGLVKIDSLAQGSYRITVTDGSSRGCSFRMPPAFINGPGAEVRNVSVTPVSCFGAADGGVELLVSGNPSYLWSNGSTNEQLSNVSGGFYAVTVTEGFCESIIDSIFIPEPDSIKIFMAMREPSCFDSPDGGLSVEVFGGNGGYNYQWSNGGFSPSINGLLAGNYQLTITDSKLCSSVESLSLSAPDTLRILVDSAHQVSCNGAADGLISLRAEGGTAPYQYAWSNGSTSPQVSNLSPGTYTVSVTDFNSCITTQSFNITEPDVLSIKLEAIEQPICLGDTSGSIQISASGGTAPYQFLWSNDAQTDSLQNLGVGRYQAIAIDANGCQSDTLSVNLEAVSNLNLQIMATGPSCEGINDGSISLSANGIAPFQYNWSTGDTLNNIQNLSAGTFQVTIVDGEGCQGDTSITINNRTQPIDVSFNIIEPQCANTDDGLINVNIMRADNQPLSFAWNDGALIRDRQNILPGLYQLSITDQVGCMFVSDTLEVNSTPPIQIELVSEGLIKCQGDTNGFLEVAVEGGVAPFTYNWVGTRSTENAAYDLSAGNYQLFVVDANGCPANASYRIEEPTLLEVDLNVEIGNICFGDSTNLLSLEVNGGVGPYNFIWSNGSTDSVVQNLRPGDYVAAVRDANQCLEVLPTIKVREPGAPLQLEVFRTLNISCFGQNDGRMEVFVKGGTAPFTYIFSNASILSSDDPFAMVGGLSADDDYKVVVSDAQGCRVESDIQSIIEPNLLNIKRDSIKDISCAGEADGEIYVTASGGTAPYGYLWLDENEEVVSNLEDFVFAPAGTYRAVVVDSSGCIDTLRPSTIIDTKTKLVVTDTLVDNEKCEDEANGAILLETIGGTPPYFYTWNNGRNTQSINNLAAGFYSVTVSDQERCRFLIDSIEVIPSSSSIMVSDTIQDVSCFAAGDGSIKVSLSGGLSPYQLSWEQNGMILAVDTQQLGMLDTGSYQLRVVDSIGCSDVFNYKVDEPEPLDVQLTSQDPTDSITNGTVAAIVLGGTPPLTYQWNSGATSSSIDSLAAGSYTITVTDANNCEEIAEIELVVTQVFDNDLFVNIRLFPNPSSTNLQIETQLKRPVRLNAQIIDPLGRSVWQRDLGSSRFTRQSIDLQAFQAGLHWLVLYDEKGKRVYAAKFLVLPD